MKKNEKHSMKTLLDSGYKISSPFLDFFKNDDLYIVTLADGVIAVDKDDDFEDDDYDDEDFDDFDEAIDKMEECECCEHCGGEMEDDDFCFIDESFGEAYVAFTELNEALFADMHEHMSEHMEFQKNELAKIENKKNVNEVDISILK